MSTRTWKPWMAGAITVLASLPALTGWWLIAGDDSDASSELPLSGPTSTFGGTTSDEESSDESVEEEETGDGEADGSETGTDLPRDGMRSGTTGGGTGSASTSGDRDGDGNPDDISDLAGEGEDYGPADETGPGGTDDDVVFYMPGVDWTHYADLFGGTDDPEIVCPPGFRTPGGDCVDYGDQLERMGHVPVPRGGY